MVNPTLAQLQSYLASPAALFLMMLLASFGNGMKQLVVVRQTSTAMTCWQYWTYLPESLTVLVGNILAFAFLIMTDQLNFVSAISVGYNVNSLADLIPKGRSYALKQLPDVPDKLLTPPPKLGG